MVENQIKNISHFFDFPEQAKEKELSYFSEMIKKHPYSYMCYVILAKILKYQKRTGFNILIKKAALRSNDRAHLFNLIDRNHNANNFEKIKTDSLINEKTSSPEYIKSNISTKKTKDDAILERNIFTNIISNQLTNEIENLNKEELNSEDNRLENNNHLENKRIDSKLTFEHWLYQKKPEDISEKERSVDDILKSLENRKDNKQKTNFFSSEKNAQQSLEETPTMNTETLAEIHVKQGNYPRAIKIYEQLMLSNPEKKLFFASRIKYLNSKTKL